MPSPYYFDVVVLSSVDTPTPAAIQEWIDKGALTQLVAELALAVDRADRARIEACYAEDSFDDHGPFKGSGRQFAEFIHTGREGVTMHHLLGPPVFEIDGDRARGVTPFVFHGNFGGTAVTGHGRYVDRFHRVGGAWKVVYRRVVPDRVPAGDDIGAYWAARRDGSDPSYDRRERPDPGPSG